MRLSTDKNVYFDTWKTKEKKRKLAWFGSNALSGVLIRQLEVSATRRLSNVWSSAFHTVTQRPRVTVASFIGASEARASEDAFPSINIGSFRTWRNYPNHFLEYQNNWTLTPAGRWGASVTRELLSWRVCVMNKRGIFGHWHDPRNLVNLKQESSRVILMVLQFFHANLFELEQDVLPPDTLPKKVMGVPFSGNVWSTPHLNFHDPRFQNMSSLITLDVITAHHSRIGQLSCQVVLSWWLGRFIPPISSLHQDGKQWRNTVTSIRWDFRSWRSL